MYTDAKYQNNLLGQPISIQVKICGSASSVPLDPANSDYQAIMALVEKGELTIAPADE